MKYLRLSLLLLAASLAYTPAQLLTTPAPAPMIYQLPNQRLFQAVLDKNALAIENLLKQGANINAQNEDGYLPIDIAYTQGDFYLVSLLKNHGAAVQKERIGKLPQEFKAPPISETFFEKSKLKQECIAILEDTQIAFDQFKRNGQMPLYYNSHMNNEEEFYLDFENATVQEKYPLVYLLLRKQVNVLLTHKPMNEPIKLDMIFSLHQKNLISYGAHACRLTNTIRFSWLYLYNYITNIYTPYTIWNILAHEWQHLYQLNYSTEIEAADKAVLIETEIDADSLASKTSILHINNTATHEYLIPLIYSYLSSKTTYSPTVLVALLNHILKTITDIDSNFLNSNINFIKTSLIKLIDKAHMYASKKPSSEYLQYIIQFIKNHYYYEIQKPYIQEQENFTSTHPSDKARNENTLKVRCLYEISLLKKYYGTQASVTLSPQNAPYLHALITKDLAIAAIKNKSQNPKPIDPPKQENSTPPLNPYHDFIYTIQLSNYTNTQHLIPFISKKNNKNTPSDTHDQKFFTITFPESFFIFALCNPQPHKVFSSTIIDARKKTSSNQSDNPQEQKPQQTTSLPIIDDNNISIYPFNKDAFAVFKQLYTIDLSISPQEISCTSQDNDASCIDNEYIPKYNHEKAVILFAQVAHILPELAPRLKKTITNEQIKKALEHIKKTVFQDNSSMNNISLLSSRQKSEEIVNKVAFTLFAFIANLNNIINLTTITTKINNKLIQTADKSEYSTLVKKIISTFFGTQQIPILEKLIEFNLKKTYHNHIQQYQSMNENLLHAATKSNKPKLVKLMLEKNIAINAQDDQGNTPLHYANNYQIALLLLEHGADAYINATNNAGETPLHHAILNNIEISQLLLEKGANPNVQNSIGYTPLSTAVYYNNIKAAELLLTKKANPNIALFNGHMPLHLAIQQKNIEMVRVLLQNDFNPNTPINQNLTALKFAIEQQTPQIVELLLEYGATTNNDETLLHAATQSNNLELVKLMLQQNIALNSQDDQGNTPLHYANNYQIALLLLNHGAEAYINATNNAGETPLHHAILKNHLEISQLLLNKGANPNIQNSSIGYTPLIIAINNNYIKGVELLLTNDADPNIALVNGYMPLFLAIEIENVEIVHLLLHHGANPKTSINQNLTALKFAIEQQSPQIVELLLKYGATTNDDENLLHAATQSNNLELVKLMLQQNIALNSQDDQGNTPLHYANDYQITLLLLEHGADAYINATNHSEATPLHHAILKNHLKISQLLLEKGANPNIQSSNIGSPLLITVYENNIKAAELLLTNGADPNIALFSEYIPLFLAIILENIEMVNLLLHHGANPNTPIVQNQTSKTLLHEATLKGNTQIIKLLLKKGASINAQDSDGNTPLHLANHQSNSEIIKLLLEHNADTSIKNNDEKKPEDLASNPNIDLNNNKKE